MPDEPRVPSGYGVVLPNVRSFSFFNIFRPKTDGLRVAVYERPPRSGDPQLELDAQTVRRLMGLRRDQVAWEHTLGPKKGPESARFRVRLELEDSTERPAGLIVRLKAAGVTGLDARTLTLKKILRDHFGENVQWPADNSYGNNPRDVWFP
jgi:hypothetical protein